MAKPSKSEDSDPSTSSKEPVNQNLENDSATIERVHTGLAASEFETDVQYPISNIPTQKLEDNVIQKPTGFKLYILFVVVLFSAFLMALNGSIVATVNT